MLGAGKMVDAHVIGNNEVVPPAVGGVERHSPLPIFGIGIGMEDLGASAAGGAAVEQAAPGAGNRVAAVAVGERRVGVSGAELFLVLQARAADRLGEALIDVVADRTD